ncbi:hypothetical protein RvY_14465 [Ramazzottius varieornatus]|uniref:18 kDa Sin3-associated polypeptide n=1 Tax=Ramazzottius varieornatus TaxID=947166 RepID=A0A1D1VT52_RAMVA|nr:hypothetical protein RvY_14465 [Ramazzottius varieornatus]
MSSGPRIESQVSAVNPISDRGNRIDREKTCPVLIRVFVGINRHLGFNEYGNGKLPTEQEMHIHTWLDASLRELATLIREVRPEARRPGTRLDFNILFPETQMRGYRSRGMGEVFIGQRSSEEHRTLEDARFQIGDVLDVAIGYGSRGGPRDRDRDRDNRNRDRMDRDRGDGGDKERDRDRENRRR